VLMTRCLSVKRGLVLQGGEGTGAGRSGGGVGLSPKLTRVTCLDVKVY
jgi:hypothetical protein